MKFLIICFFIFSSCSFKPLSEQEKYNKVYKDIVLKYDYSGIQKVRKEKWFDINKVYSEYSLLGKAVRDSDLEAVKVLLSAFAYYYVDVNLSGQNVLEMAAINGEVEIVKYLIDHGVNSVLDDDKYALIKNRKVKNILMSKGMKEIKDKLKREMLAAHQNCELNDDSDIKVIHKEDINLDGKIDSIQIRSCMIKEARRGKSQLEIFISGVNKPLILVPSDGVYYYAYPPSYHDVSKISVRKIDNLKGAIIHLSTGILVDTWDDYRWFVNKNMVKPLFYSFAEDSIAKAPKIDDLSIAIGPLAGGLKVNNLEVNFSISIDKDACPKDKVAMLSYRFNEKKVAYDRMKTICGKRHRQ